MVDALTDPDLTVLCESLVWLAWTEAQLERYGDSERHNDRALRIARSSGQLYVMPHLLTNRAFVHMSTCRLASALQAAEEAESIARSIASPDLLAFTLSFKALVLLMANPLGSPQAVAVGEEAVTAAAGAGSDWWISLAWCMYGYVLDQGSDPRRTQEATLREAYSLLRAAPVALAAGDPRRAAALSHRANHLISTARAPRHRPHPAEAEPSPDLSRLTPRELEVARLVAEGLSNQDIAAKLYLSRRTVEAHLSAVYRKLTVPSRSALANLVLRTDLA